MAIRRVTPTAAAAIAICALLATGCTSESDSHDPLPSKRVKNYVDPCELGNPLPNGKYALNRVLNVEILRTVEINLPGDFGSRRTCRFDNGTVAVETFAEAKGSTAVYDALTKDLKGGYNLHSMVEHEKDFTYPSTPASSPNSASAQPKPSVSLSSKKVSGFWLTNRGVREAALFNVGMYNRRGYKVTVLVTINRSAKISNGVFATLVQNMRQDAYNVPAS